MCVFMYEFVFKGFTYGLVSVFRPCFIGLFLAFAFAYAKYFRFGLIFSLIISAIIPYFLVGAVAINHPSPINFIISVIFGVLIIVLTKHKVKSSLVWGLVFKLSKGKVLNQKLVGFLAGNVVGFIVGAPMLLSIIIPSIISLPKMSLEYSLNLIGTLIGVITGVILIPYIINIGIISKYLNKGIITIIMGIALIIYGAYGLFAYLRF